MTSRKPRNDGFGYKFCWAADETHIVTHNTIICNVNGQNEEKLALNNQLLCNLLGSRQAIDPIMSGTFQALQSYTIDDIVFDKEFAPCVVADPLRQDGKTIFRKRLVRFLRRVFVGRSSVGRSVKVDLDSFHKIVEIGEG